jgi:hypothetical protein
MSELAPQSLQIFQQDFMAAINNMDGPNELSPQMKTIGALSSKEVLGLYRNDYRFRMAQALGETYETCWCLLGDDVFFDMAFKYIWQHPSSFFNLSNYGKNFPQFLQQEGTDDNELLLAMATFELNFWNLFHADVAENIQLAQILKKFPTLESSLQHSWHFHSELYFFSSTWSLWDLFCLRKEGLGEKSLDAFEIPQSGILYRQGALVKAAILPTEQWKLLQSMREGMTPFAAITSSPASSPGMIQELFTFLNKHPIIASV